MHDSIQAKVLMIVPSKLVARFTIVSDSIPLNVEEVISEIVRRQEAPWNNGGINNCTEFPILQKLFYLINSGIPVSAKSIPRLLPDRKYKNPFSC